MPLAFVSLALVAWTACSSDRPGTMPMRDGGSAATGDATGDATTEPPTGCTPGAGACDGATYYICGEDGISQTEPMDCPGACDPVAGCVACTPGQRRCEGTSSMVCAQDGTGFVTARDCTENGVGCGANGFCEDACGVAESTRSNIGCEYWPVPLANLGQWEGRYDFRVVVTNPGDAPANVRVFRSTTMVAEAVVPPQGIEDLVLPWVEGVSDGFDQTNPGESFGLPNAAYRLISDRPVTVAQFNPFEYDNGQTVAGPEGPTPDYSFSNDASLLLPAHSFTGDYIAASYVPLSRVSQLPNPLLPFLPPVRSSQRNPGYLAIVGITPEPTQVEVSVTAAVAADRGGRFGATPRGEILRFTIQRGEVVHIVNQPSPECTSGRPGYRRRSLCAPDQPDCGFWFDFCAEREFDLTGSRVRANHPLAVFGGHTCAYVPSTAEACDHLENQMPPLQTWGTEYVSGPLGDLGGPVRNIVRVTSAFPDTQVTVDPPQGGTSSLTLGAGQWQEFEATTPFRVAATQGVMVTQYLVGQFASDPPAERGDPAMIVLLPEAQFRSDYAFVTPTSYNEETQGQSYLLIVRPIDLAVSLDGSPVNAEWTTVGDREVGAVPVAGGAHEMEAAASFGVLVYGMGQFTSYAYPAGLNLEEILLI